MKPKTTIENIMPKIGIRQGLRHATYHLYSELLRYGDNDLFGWTVDKSEVRMTIEDIIPGMKTVADMKPKASIEDIKPKIKLIEEV